MDHAVWSGECCVQICSTYDAECSSSTWWKRFQGLVPQISLMMIWFEAFHVRSSFESVFIRSCACSQLLESFSSFPGRPPICGEYHFHLDESHYTFFRVHGRTWWSFCLMSSQGYPTSAHGFKFCNNANPNFSWGNHWSYLNERFILLCLPASLERLIREKHIILC